MPSVYVNIGRGTADGELSPREWAAFKRAVRDAIEDGPAGPVVAATEGLGEWEGQVETCAAFVGAPAAVCTIPWKRFTARLAAIATLFRQDAIAVAVAEARFVEAGPVDYWRDWPPVAESPYYWRDWPPVAESPKS